MYFNKKDADFKNLNISIFMQVDVIIS